MKSDRLLLVACGAVIMLAQYIAVREIGSTFFSTEIIAVLSTFAILLGPCLAYAIADHVGERFLIIWSIVTFVALALLPTGVRYLVAVMTAIHLEWVAMVVVFLVAILFSSAFFAVFLPRYARSAEDFRTLYLCELAGAVGAITVVCFLGSWLAILTFFWFVIVVVIHLAFRKLPVSLFSAVLLILAASSYSSMDRYAACKYYRAYWRKKNPRVLKVKYSPYQRIEVVQSKSGLSLHLDGVPYYDGDDLDWFNYYMAKVPGQLAGKKRRALVIGSGSLGGTGHLVRQGFEVTTVDLDREVPEVGLEFFQTVNKIDRSKFNLEIADARRYIRTVNDGAYDVIVLDVPAPYKLQPALLYTPSFFRELRRCTSSGGIVSINSCSYDPSGSIASPIIASAAESFKELAGVRGGSMGLTILYCSDKLPFTTGQLSDLLKDDKHGFTVYSDDAVRYAVRHAKPHSKDNLCALLLLSRYEVPGIGKWVTD